MGILYSIYQTFISFSSDPDIICAIFPSAHSRYHQTDNDLS
jgi:hypothetical protein